MQLNQKAARYIYTSSDYSKGLVKLVEGPCMCVDTILKENGAPSIQDFVKTFDSKIHNPAGKSPLYIAHKYFLLLQHVEFMYHSQTQSRTKKSVSVWSSWTHFKEDRSCRRKKRIHPQTLQVICHFMNSHHCMLS